jgi:hypothetical protein
MSQSEEVEAVEIGEGELPESKVLTRSSGTGRWDVRGTGDRSRESQILSIDDHIAQDFDEREVSVGRR